jgi:hypothetical protein
MSHALAKQKHLDQIKCLLLMHPEGIHIDEIRQIIAPDMDWSSIWRYVVKDLQAQKLSKGVYTLEPTKDDLNLAIAVLERTDPRRTNHGAGIPRRYVDILAMYDFYQRGHTLREVGEQFKINPTQVWTLFKRHNLPRREAKRLRREAG